MNNKEILYYDGFDEVILEPTQETVFSTLGINENVVLKVVSLWNSKQNKPLLGSNGIIDNYLLNSYDCTQEQREVIIESLSKIL